MIQENIPGTPAQHQVTTSHDTDLAFVFSLIGGIVITIGSIVMIGLAAFGRPLFWGAGGMMNYYPYMISGYSYGSNLFYNMMYGFEFLGLVMGIIVIVLSVVMRSRPSERKAYGTMILAFSLVSITGMGGFFIGALFGIIGGLLALTSQ
jgi:hypothetical protein